MHPLEKHWARLTWLSALLVPLSIVFAAIAWLRRAAYRSGLLRARRIGVPVIVIGNITAGGTGKTPLAIALVEALRTPGFRPGIVSRGYRGQETLSVVTAESDPAETGDEPVLLAARARCPVWVGADRVAAAQALLKNHPDCDVILSDDGLQHYRLARDIEIAVIDGSRGFGNRLPLPAGPMREPVSRLAQVDAIVINGDGEPALPDVPQFRMALCGTQLRNLLDADRLADAASFRGTSVHAIAGIGNPSRFFAQLRELGLHFTEHVFPDHHRFTPVDLKPFADHAVIMTEKDAIKCVGFAKRSWWVLPVDASIDPALADLITAKLYALHGR
ncbi:MAG: tetraacyldisaccharide 4'-kinase [Burkholderiales bacterium]